MKHVIFSGVFRAGKYGAVALAVTGLLAACVTPPPRVVSVPVPPPQRVFVYPAQGQSPQQADRDRYECHNWAVQQTGVDPSRVASYQQVVVQPANPPGSGAVGGAVAGAIIGSIIAGPWHAGAGALVGGATGAVVGSAADANAQKQAQQTQQQINQAAAAGQAQGDAYRRAFGACLTARGYTVN
ncbi:MAG: glycine zipper 2TM domain-containing protein [Steroidobacteraceae bacterium]